MRPLHRTAKRVLFRSLVLLLVFTLNIQIFSIRQDVTVAATTDLVNGESGTQIYLDNKRISLAMSPIVIRGSLYVDMESLLRAFRCRVTTRVLEDPNPSTIVPMTTSTPIRSPEPTMSTSPNPSVDVLSTPSITLMPDQTPEPTVKPFTPYVDATCETKVYRFEQNGSGVWSGKALDEWTEWDHPVMEVDGIWYLPLRAFGEWQQLDVHRARFVDAVYLVSSMKRTLDQLLPEINQWVYAGDVWGGIRQGLGQLYRNGSMVYDGQFESDRMNGAGVLYLNGRVVYDGAFENNYPDGSGVYYDRNGEVYEGYFLDGQRSGRGTLRLGANILYDGEWLRDRMNGSGTLYDKSQNIRYIGEMKNNLRHGFGSSYMDSKTDYRGNWANGLKHGQGSAFDFKSGKVTYDGQFANGMMDGTGTQFTYGKIPWIVLDTKGSSYAYKRDVVYWTQVQMRAGKLLTQDKRILMYVGETNNEGYPEGKGTFYVQTTPSGRDAKSLMNYRKVVDGTFKDGRLSGEITIYDEKNMKVVQQVEGEMVWSLDW